MEKHKCKLCFRNFSNGRALGGHMRSHMVNLPVPPKQTEEPPLAQLSFEAESAPSSSSSSEEEEEDDDKGISYGLRDNPKRSIRFVDPEFSFAVIESSSVIPQDRESETESSMNPTRRRSKRPRNQYDHLHHHHYHHHRHDHHHHHYKQIQEQDAFKKQKSTNKVISSNNNNNNNKTESCWAEPEPVSSISDATTEEDVAFCLMMLSRDKWKRQKDQEKEQEEDNGEEEEEDDDDDEEDDEAERSLEDSDEFSEELKSSKTTRSVRGKYKCETCKKVFRSYQALGGHRASHKKIKVPPTTNNTASHEPELEQEKKIHECPVCFRVFASGQALGGHKRTHVTGSSSTSVRTSTKFADNFIDLNLPAPIDDDDVSQIENSAVSDAEFLKPNTRIIDAQAA